MTEVLQSPATFSSANVQLHSHEDFFSSLSRDVSATHPGDRVAITTMALAPEEPLIHNLLTNLNKAAERSVAVSMGVDAYTLLESRALGPLVAPSLPHSEKARRRIDALAQLASHDSAHTSILNSPSTLTANLFAGRSHIKLAITNNIAYIGGPNLQGTDRSDIAVSLQHQPTVDWLHQLTTDITRAGNTKEVLGETDQWRSVDDKTDILIDAGKPGQSLILDEAMHIIDTATERLVIASQYLPTGTIGKKLVEAMARGVDVRVIHNHPSKHGRMSLAHYAIFAREKLVKPTNFFKYQVSLDKPLLHAKVIANEHTAMVGSHNLVATGVKFGTPEIALKHTDPGFANAVNNLIFSMVV